MVAQPVIDVDDGRLDAIEFFNNVAVTIATDNQNMVLLNGFIIPDSREGNQVSTVNEASVSFNKTGIVANAVVLTVLKSVF
jgi:hypothetical protein